MGETLRFKAYGRSEVFGQAAATGLPSAGETGDSPAADQRETAGVWSRAAEPSRTPLSPSANVHNQVRRSLFRR